MKENKTEVGKILKEGRLKQKSKIRDPMKLVNEGKQELELLQKKDSKPKLM